MRMDLKLKIFTLNCWGIVGISRHRKERMEAIAEHLASSDYDFVFLQELWSQSDYQLICKKSGNVLPYSFYFHSGVIGSGVCIMSKSIIVDAMQSKFSLNGYAHKILHGDWYGGKVVGMCKVMHQGLKVNLYITHLHAEYNTFHDEYLSHRVAQAFEFSQFVRLTSETADLSIVAGDFNTEPTDLPYQLIVHNSGCLDSYVCQKNPDDIDFPKTTCGHPNNLYTTGKELIQAPKGKRIDYVLYKCGANTFVECLSSETPLNKIPGTEIPYSDHEAVVSQLHVFKSLDAPLQPESGKSRLDAITNGHIILQKSIKDLRSSRLLFFFASSLIFALLCVTSFIEDIGILGIFILVFQFVATIVLAFCLWMALIVNKIEFSALMSACKTMEVLIGSLMQEYINDSVTLNFQLPQAPEVL